MRGLLWQSLFPLSRKSQSKYLVFSFSYDLFSIFLHQWHTPNNYGKIKENLSIKLRAGGEGKLWEKN